MAAPSITVTDILVSPAWIWYSPIGTALPDETTVAAGADWGVGWICLGSTLEPVSLAYETENFELEVQQSTAVVKLTRQRETVRFETTLAEMKSQALALVTDGTVTNTPAGANQHGFDEIKAGGKVDISMYQWGIEGVRVDATNFRLPVRFFMLVGSAVLNGTLSFAKDAGAGIPIQINSMAAPGAAAGQQLLVIHNVTTKKTS